MLDNLKEQYKEIQNPKGYLTSCFLMCDFKDINKEKWQFNFYNNDKITSYKDNKIIEKDAEVHKKKGEKLKELDLEEIKITPKEAINKAKEEIKVGEPNKIIIVIQNKIYNITFLTNAMRLINIKLLASDNTIIETKEENLLNLQSQ